jgi:hypothetical protein|tara:strand:- start:388 stop:759 length:372 start_codon:yes stop_codon:yes gene_type:complete
MIDKLIKPVSDILDKFVADKDLKLKLSHELEKEIVSLNRAQIELNKVEAAHENVFVSGWRPFIGWACGIALVYHFLLEPIIQYILILSGADFKTPEFDFSQLSTIVMAMLGMSSLRTYEKTKK